MIDLTDDERDLLKWLSREQYSQFGECHSKALDALIVKGLVHVHNDGGQLGNFSPSSGSYERNRMFNSVELTDKGRIVALDLVTK